MTVNNNRVLIFRGLPGAGKSTYLSKHFPNAVVCSADQYFIDQSGNYNFNPKLLNEAHRSCFRKFLTACNVGNKLIAVDNTNTQLFEFYGYVQVALAYAFDLEIIRLETPIDIAAKRNVHGVSLNNVKLMKERFQEIPSFLNLNEKIIGG